MKRTLFLSTAFVLAMPAYAQSTAPIFAQQLVDKALAAHPELTVLALHVTPPAAADNIIIASNIGRIGKKADDDDLSVLNTGKPRIEMTKSGDLSVEVPMHDHGGQTIGVVGETFRYHAGDDKSKTVELAEQVRDELASQTPSLAKLFERAK
ncbi:conserved exported hypothetical protein [Paraburkholderia piptadeniae]|uniref:Uncharacterized protein n=1 Tax=Paraburkholderia piptadeniae TaxID=1701573 RepID=A0A1N7SK86_9BURK|nr:hypothetical protein [Paraburkholderia piptadeniae]SIT47790.1 conserved exported hypothetical protein [Paraburkholderia piptadeniae]